MRKSYKRLSKNHGASLPEYLLMVCLIAMAMIAGTNIFNKGIVNAFTLASDCIAYPRVAYPDYDTPSLMIGGGSCGTVGTQGGGPEGGDEGGPGETN